jgi:hypothetical protein
LRPASRLVVASKLSSTNFYLLLKIKFLFYHFFLYFRFGLFRFYFFIIFLFRFFFAFWTFSYLVSILIFFSTKFFGFFFDFFKKLVCLDVVGHLHGAVALGGRFEAALEERGTGRPIEPGQQRPVLLEEGPRETGTWRRTCTTVEQGLEVRGEN